MVRTLLLAACVSAWSAADPPAEQPPRKRNSERIEPGSPQPIGPVHEVSLDQLIGELKDPSLGTRRFAASLIASRGAKAKTAVPALITALKDDREPVMRAAAAEALGGIGFNARAAVQPLLAALKDSDPQVRETAAEALADINVDAKTVVPALVGLFADPDVNVRCAAANSLAAFGTEARDAVPELKKLLKDKHLFVREAAADAIHTIDQARRKIGS